MPTTPATELVTLTPQEPEPHDQLPPDEDPTAPKPGRWYWVREKDRRGKVTRWFGCVTHLGSNYVFLEGPLGHTERVLNDEFEETCAFEPNPDEVIQGRIDEYQGKVRGLLTDVRAITMRLAITNDPALTSGRDMETSALALHSGQPMDEYKAALVQAKEKTLPELFEQIKDSNKALSKWMSATLIPLQAQAEGLEPAIEAINKRIFSVTLYAGLSEDIEQIREGEPAEVTEKLHLFQRRAYMDEECLAQYEVGGMEFKDIPAFDRWLIRQDNLNRLLPFPRCVLAFQVRRNEKRREVAGVADFVRMMDDSKYDKLTFLYMRNGEQVFRLSTAIEFDSKLFPDMGHQTLSGGKLYAKVWGSGTKGNVQRIISEDEYKGMVESERRQQREVEEKQREAEKLPEGKRPYFSSYVSYDSHGYQPFNHDNIYYDDIAKHVKDTLAKHNRLVLVLQGLLDRSPVFHPHPQWRIWQDGGFEQALELHYDDSLALVAGPKPDFKAYREQLNAGLKTGCVTVGQQNAWLRAEGRKESERRRNRGGRDYYPEHYQPSGNPGPGRLAFAVVGTKLCTYRWVRESYSHTSNATREIGCTFKVKRASVFNVSAYKPGDFKQFFNDPRTRSEYLQWAYLLLTAEEFHAGNLKAAEPKLPPPRQTSAEGAAAYRRRKMWDSFLDKAVRITRDITTQGGKKYDKGSLWRVTYRRGGLFDIVGINPDGTFEEDGERHVREVREWSFKIDDTVPPAPPKPKRESKSKEPEEDADGDEDEDEDDE